MGVLEIATGAAHLKSYLTPDEQRFVTARCLDLGSARRRILHTHRPRGRQDERAYALPGTALERAHLLV